MVLPLTPGAIDSLVAKNIIHTFHNSNHELIGQGVKRADNSTQRSAALNKAENAILKAANGGMLSVHLDSLAATKGVSRSAAEYSIVNRFMPPRLTPYISTADKLPDR
ncbi:MAG TPA: hypothetical protein ENJ65_01630 [Candidatus Tenderia electrophaga]|uniref:Uncharacterized protein n=1 Tax=Candidatus Tenderia electrophaga TaxID=1748243 RepID=A0A832N4V7_9GAMM|nr:hypothetical protein [Candidatus Tenderia electrophaga]